ncbi:MAG TPA: hypothetical protein VLD35_03580 [Caldimonas sp.]|nr:hypothetical protein [Caldimonas sp.]
MSMLEGLAATLAEMSFVQLALVFLAVGGYSMAINGAFGSSVRSGAASASFVAAVAFSALTPSWISGVVFLGVSVLAVAAFAGAAWMLSALLGLGAERGVMVAVEAEEEERAPFRLPVPQSLRALAASVIRSPL